MRPGLFGVKPFSFQCVDVLRHFFEIHLRKSEIVKLTVAPITANIVVFTISSE